MLFRSSEDHTVPISTQDQQEDNIDKKLLSWAMANNLLEELEKQSNHFEVDAAKVNVTFSQLIFRTKISPGFFGGKISGKKLYTLFFVVPQKSSKEVVPTVWKKHVQYFICFLFCIVQIVWEKSWPKHFHVERDWEWLD